MTPTDHLPEAARWQRLALLAGAVGLVICLLALVLPEARTQVLRAWLVAFCFVVGIALGSLVVLMLQYLTGGAWGFVLRRPLEAATRTIPYLTLAYLPIALGMPLLYVWADPAKVELDVHLQHKAPYLNVPFAITRTMVFFAIWSGLAFLLTRWSRMLDRNRDKAILQRCETLSAPGIILYVVTITFASIDWAMSLEPHWYSTIYAAMFGMGQVLGGFAFAVSVLALAGNRPPLDQAVAGNDRRDLGSLLMAFVMVWAYLSFSQFLLIWAGNLPEETPWYISRLEGGWVWAALALVLFHFALPFVLLLSTDIKRDRARLASVALLVLFMRMIDLIWLIVPAFGHHHEGEASPATPVYAPLLYAAALIGLGGVWLGGYLAELRRQPLLPEFGPDREGATHGAVAGH